LDGKLLISIARASIAAQFGLHFSVRESETWLHRPAASFVTLKTRGELRGCIGSLAAHRALVDDVRANARAAAFQDPRFRPLGFQELAMIRVEVSVLSALEPMTFKDQADALDRIRPGVDGLVLEFGGHRGTFLPQVWDSLPQPATFLAELKRKAGLPADFWDPGVRLSRYTVAKWSEPDTAS
jgi:AmmeMemoRadiSam system protein A